MKTEAFRRIGKLYPKIKDEDGVERTVIAWIWARTVNCPNPACGAVIDGSYIKEESCSGRMGARLMAIVAEGNNGRLYLSPSKEHVEAAQCPAPENAPESNMPEKALAFVFSSME